MVIRSIPQRELRNNIGEVLRQAERGAEFTITVRGRAVARLGPLASPAPRVDLDRSTLEELLQRTPVDAELEPDIAALRELEEPAEAPST